MNIDLKWKFGLSVLGHFFDTQTNKRFGLRLGNFVTGCMPLSVSSHYPRIPGCQDHLTRTKNARTEKFHFDDDLGFIGKSVRVRKQSC